MRRPGEKIVLGVSIGDTKAAQWRTAGDYWTAAVIERFYGERREQIDRKTANAIFDPEECEWDKRCNDSNLAWRYA